MPSTMHSAMPPHTEKFSLLKGGKRRGRKSAKKSKKGGKRSRKSRKSRK